MDPIRKTITNLAALGGRKLALLAAACTLITATVIFGSVYLNKPSYQPIYVGLESNEITSMGAALSEAGIAYDISADGASLLVPTAMMSRARMVLAERGLPNSANTGYELFDNLGSLGLTAFMQEVTRVRALEGEVARSIQAIKGVRSARVHLGMGEDRSLRTAREAPKASVVVRFTGNNAAEAAGAIRHLVASAVPGLSVDGVTVLDASGRILASGDDEASGTSTAKLALKRTVEDGVVENIAKALGSYLGELNFHVSVQVDISTDQRNIEETVFDPDSRVERSVQVVRSENSANSQPGSEAVTVEQNIVADVPVNSGGPQSTEQSERLEETTQYELNSKRIATVSTDYDIERISIAVVINRNRILEELGANATQADIDARVEQLKQVVIASAGYMSDRGDMIEITAVPFIDTEADMGQSPSIVDGLLPHLGSVANALASILVTWLVLKLGVGPLLARVDRDPSEALQISSPAGDEHADAADGADRLLADAAMQAPNLEPLLLGDNALTPEERLIRLVDLDMDKATRVLRRWVRDERSAA